MRPTLLLKILSLNLLTLLFQFCYGQQNKPFCGTSDSLTEAYLQRLARQIDLTKVRENAGETLEYRLAIDVNHKTFLDYGGDKARIRRIVYDLFSQASAIFERETNIKLTVNFIYIWDQPEPYALVNDIDYFTNVMEYWHNNRREERDAVVSLSNRSGTYYGGYRMCSSNFPAPGTTIPVDILAHELGHTLGSPHTHSCYWPGGPIDRCYPLEGPSETCPSSFIESVNGTIMSYCRSKLTFHPICRNLIRSYAEGAMNPSFSLEAFDGKPVSPGLLAVNNGVTQSTNATPQFEWYPSPRTKQYRVQIARDKTFLQIVDDTLVNQSFFQTTGLSEGQYFVRYRTENELGISGWSLSPDFTVSPLSGTSSPPLLTPINRDNSGVLSGTFRVWPGVSSYQVRLEEIQYDRTFEITPQPDQLTSHTFTIDLGDKRQNEFSLRYRVKMNGIWTQWSDPVWQIRPIASIPLSTDSTKLVSASPVLAIKQWLPLISREPVYGSLEIAKDPEFKNIVFQQPFSSNAMGDFFTDKIVLQPSLDENTTYFSRSQVQFVENRKSAWSAYRFTTGVRDSRFRLVGTPFPGMRSTNFSMSNELFNRFVNTGDVLYVANFQCGYHKTSDLKSWESYIPSTTKGQSPMLVTYFGASPQGETLVGNEQQDFVHQVNGQYKNVTIPVNVGWSGVQEILYTSKYGFFVRTNGVGIAQFYNGNWVFHREQVPMGHAMCMAKDSQETIWAVGQDGIVWRYQDGQWSNNQSRVPEAGWIDGMAFDKNDNCVVYGKFGVYRQTGPAGNWELIEPLRPFPVKKVVFDNANNMWLASYSWNNDWSNPKIENYALVKYTGTQASVYSDGLNFLREMFDIEFFKGQLLIMTTGGEIHAFDEKQILTFNSKPVYCTGSTVALTVSSNSSFGFGNKTTVQLRNTETNKVISWAVELPASRNVAITLPDTLSKGRYLFSIRTTNPEIISNESAAFDISPPPATQTPVVEQNTFNTTLKIEAREGDTYQWILDGTPIAGATSTTLVANKNGSYAVTITNQGGCAITTEPANVEINNPKDLVLLQNKPNPVVSSTDISFYLPATEKVQLALFNVRGQKVAELKNGTVSQGWHSVSINGNSIAAGTYIYRLKAGNATRSLKMIKQ